MDNSSPDATVKGSPAKSQPGETSGQRQPSHASCRDPALAATPPRSPELLLSGTLRKGSGAIRGTGAKLTVDAALGTLTVLLTSGPRWAGFGPQLPLTYNSGIGNGPFGVDWSLGLPPVRHKTDPGLPPYFDGNESDISLLSCEEDVVPVLDHGGDGVRWRRTVHGVTYDIFPYRPRIEGLFARMKHGETHSREARE